MFSLKIAIVATARECATFVSCTKNCFMLSADMEMNCITTTNVSYASSHMKLPAGWFLLCGRTVFFLHAQHAQYMLNGSK